MIFFDVCVIRCTMLMCVRMHGANVRVHGADSAVM